MKAFAVVCLTSAVVMASFALPLERYGGGYYQPYYKKSVAIGGDAGDGGDAVAVGADVTAGIGGAAASDVGLNINKGYQAGGDGYADVVAANGAVGTVYGSGSIYGTFSNDATAGDGGDGGDAYAH